MRAHARLGDSSMDGHARFNLSPVPSVGDDDDDGEDDGVGHQTERGLQSVNQEDSGEETEPVSNAPSGTTTTVTLFDTNDGVSSPPPNRHDDQGEMMRHAVRMELK